MELNTKTYQTDREQYLDETIIITGGASWIGKAIAKVFAEIGASAFIIDIEQAELNKTVNEI